jgi:hypothetical protein
VTSKGRKDWSRLSYHSSEQLSMGYLMIFQFRQSLVHERGGPSQATREQQRPKPILGRVNSRKNHLEEELCTRSRVGLPSNTDLSDGNIDATKANSASQRRNSTFKNSIYFLSFGVYELVVLLTLITSSSCSYCSSSSTTGVA